MGSAELIGALETQLGDLFGAQQRLAQGTLSATTLRGEIASIIAAATSIAQYALVTAGSQAQQSEGALRAASGEARMAVAAFVDDVYERKIFDPYLRFASADEEAAYRAREADRRRGIETALTDDTPRGNLSALRLANDQMLDASAHGASASPQFEPLRQTLLAREAELQAQVERQEAAAARAPRTQTNDDPLAAIKPSANLSPDLLASLRATGVTAESGLGEGHGVTAALPAPRTTNGIT